MACCKDNAALDALMDANYEALTLQKVVDIMAVREERRKEAASKPV